ncbi:MAG: DUF2341 domain-containing protein, partial [Thermoplasmata archaeon]
MSDHFKRYLKFLPLLAFIFFAKSVFSGGWYAITIQNTQNVNTPAPFQQEIAICNGYPNVGSNFAYVVDPALFNEINSNGQNVYFTDANGNMLYSWYEGQGNYGATCDVWWLNISSGIPANSNITIYMYVGTSNQNFYQMYYPYVGVSPQVDPSRRYDNGNYTFIAYGYFNSTFDRWTGYKVPFSDP